MSKRAWHSRAVQLLRHDLTLVVLVIALLGASAAVIAALRPRPGVAAEHPAVASLPVVEEPAEPSVLPEVSGGPPAAAPAPDPNPLGATRLAAAEGGAVLAAFPARPERELPAVDPEPQLRVLRGRLAKGETLSRSMRRRGISADKVHVIARELRGLFDFRHAQPGHGWRLALDAEGEIVEFHYSVSQVDGYLLQRDADGFVASHEEVELRPRATRIAGIVSTTLHRAVVDLGERGGLANDFADIFAWDVDFTRTVQSGDEFRILYERLYRLDPDEGEVYVRLGRILAARFDGSAGSFSAVYFEPDEGRGGYYRPDGRSVQGLFLQAPLRFSRISSRYAPARRHPILKVTRPHHGIDYAAPYGTPVWSVADGKVVYRGWAGGFGNLVKVRHSNGYISYYAHLSRFAKGLKVGQSVSQKQMVGYVGQTGLATGPHVCFRVARNGQFVNPAVIDQPAGDPVPPERLDLFRTSRDLLLIGLEGGALVEVEEAL